MIIPFRSALFVLCFVCFVAVNAAAMSPETETVEVANEVVRDVMAIPEKSIPPTLLRNAYAVAVFPGVVKGAFIIGGRYGKGILCVRRTDGTWSPPVFLTLTGGSLGFQAGAQSTDVILVFKSRKSVQGLLDGKFTIGADASAAAGPVGRQAAAGTDIAFKSEIYSYSRSRGLFAGISLQGAVLEIDGGANASFYQRPAISGREVASGQGLAPPQAARRFQRVLSEYSIPPYQG